MHSLTACMHAGNVHCKLLYTNNNALGLHWYLYSCNSTYYIQYKQKSCIVSFFVLQFMFLVLIVKQICISWSLIYIYPNTITDTTYYKSLCASALHTKPTSTYEYYFKSPFPHFYYIFGSFTKFLFVPWLGF